MDLTWSNRMSVGNETIDLEHKKILDLVVEIDRIIKTKDTVLYTHTLDLLEETTRKHFGNEEKIAQAIQFPFAEHVLEHRYILDEFVVIKNELADNRGVWSESVVEHYFEFLTTWAIDHIVEDDMKMKVLLETYPYDFKPDGLVF